MKNSHKSVESSKVLVLGRMLLGSLVFETPSNFFSALVKHNLVLALVEKIYSWIYFENFYFRRTVRILKLSVRILKLSVSAEMIAKWDP